MFVGLDVLPSFTQTELLLFFLNATGENLQFAVFYIYRDIANHKTHVVPKRLIVDRIYNKIS